MKLYEELAARGLIAQVTNEDEGGVVVDVLPGEHFPHIGAPGGVADHGGAAADEGDGLNIM